MSEFPVKRACGWIKRQRGGGDWDGQNCSELLNNETTAVQDTRSMQCLLAGSGGSSHAVVPPRHLPARQVSKADTLQAGDHSVRASKVLGASGVGIGDHAAHAGAQGRRQANGAAGRRRGCGQRGALTARQANTARELVPCMTCVPPFPQLVDSPACLFPPPVLHHQAGCRVHAQPLRRHLRMGVGVGAGRVER